MWLYLILISLYNGLSSNTLSFYYPYFKQNSFQSFVFEENIFYNLLFYPDPITGEWKINNKTLITKVPYLAASSLKQRNSKSFLSLDFITPVSDTFNKVFLSFNTQRDTNSYYYKTLSTIGYTFFKRKTKILSMFFKTSDRTFANITYFNTKHFSAKTEGLWKENLNFAKIAFNYNKGIFKIGLFYWNTQDKIYGISGQINSKDLSLMLNLPTNLKRPFYTFSFNHPPLSIFMQKDLKYKVGTLAPFLEKKFLLSLNKENIAASIWKIDNGSVHLYGTSFVTYLSSSIGAGFNTVISENTHHTSMVFSSSNTFYKGELQYSLLIQLDNMQYIYYSVEILSFKNLILRKIKDKNGDFIGIFVRLVN